jgi:hypothetical protein
MEGTCAVEVGLLKKKPCGEKAVSKCANCEIGLCSKHAVGQMSGGKKVFLCPECARAWKAAGDVPAATPVKKPEDKAAAGAHKPASAAPPKPVAKPAAGAKPAAAKPKEAPKEEHKVDDDAPLEFTPSKKPDEKK